MHVCIHVHARGHVCVCTVLSDSVILTWVAIQYLLYTCFCVVLMAHGMVYVHEHR